MRSHFSDSQFLSLNHRENKTGCICPIQLLGEAKMVKAL